MPGQTLTDEMLVEQYRQRNNDALPNLIARYLGVIDGKLSAYPAFREEHDDAKQEMLIALLNAVKTFDPAKGAGFATYASRCMDNALRNFLVRSGTKKVQLLRQAISLDSIDELHNLNHDSDNPEKLLIDQESYQHLLEAIDIDLSDFEKNVLFSYLDGESYQEISSRFDSSLKAVDNAMQRVRRKLKTVFEN